MDFDFQIINKLLITAIDLFGIWLAFRVYSADKKNSLNRGFIFFIFFNLAWINFYNISFWVDQHDLSLLFTRLLYSSVNIFFIFFYYLFVIWFLKEKGQYLFFGRLIIAYEVLSAIGTAFTDIVIKDIEFGRLGVIPIYSMPGALIYHVVIIVLTCFITWALVSRYFQSSKEMQLKIKYLLFGVVIFSSGNLIFGVFLPFFFGITDYLNVANYSTLFLTGFTAYAAIKQRLFGVKVVLTSFFVFLLMTLYIVDIVALTPSLSLQVLAFKCGILLIIIVFGLLLVRSVNNEIKQREKVEKMAHRLEKANEKLKELDSAKTTFLSLASHQLRTPLTVIKGVTSMMMDGDYGEVSKKIKGYLSMIQQSSDRLIDLLESFLDISKIELGRIEYKFEKVNLINMVDDVIKELSIKIKDKKLKLVYNKPKNLPMISIDASKIREVIVNLIENGIKYNKEHGDLTIRLRRVKDALEFCVIDSGIGIDKDNISQVFKKFSRTDSAMEYADGNGLGLYVAKEILKVHKGSIWAESKGQDQGAKFCFKLPIS